MKGCLPHFLHVRFPSVHTMSSCWLLMGNKSEVIKILPVIFISMQGADGSSSAFVNNIHTEVAEQRERSSD